MADTINNTLLGGAAWQNINTATGITVGTEIIIQNQTNNPIYAYIGTTAPSAIPRPARGQNPNGTEGYVLIPPLPAINERRVTAGENAVWLFGDGPVNVQEV